MNEEPLAANLYARSFDQELLDPCLAAIPSTGIPPDDRCNQFTGELGVSRVPTPEVWKELRIPLQPTDEQLRLTQNRYSADQRLVALWIFEVIENDPNPLSRISLHGF